MHVQPRSRQILVAVEAVVSLLTSHQAIGVGYRCYESSFTRFRSLLCYMSLGLRWDTS